jgi:NPCBM/NEW2 domain-containing protein
LLPTVDEIPPKPERPALQTIVRILAVLIVAALPTLARSQEVTATLLDSTSITGELRAWSRDEVVIAATDKEVRLPAEKLVSMRWSDAAPLITAKESDKRVVELTDGTLLPINDFQATKSTAKIEIGMARSSDQMAIALPLRDVVSVRLQGFEPEIDEQWDQIRSQNLASDVLVVVSPRGKNIDGVEGILGDITTAKVQFELDGNSMRVDRARVAGWIYFRKNSSTRPEPRCILHGRSGLRGAVRDVRLTGQTLDITTSGGTKLNWPLADLRFADFSAGKILYLSDLTPSSERWTPLVGLSPAAESAAKYGRVRLDQSAFGGPLKLLVEGSANSARSVKSFSKGIAIRSRTELVYRLPTGFKQFVALAGIEPATSSTGDVRIKIYGDDRSLCDADIAGDEAPREIKLDIAGFKRLKIVVDFGQNLDTGDWLNLCEARLIK